MSTLKRLSTQFWFKVRLTGITKEEIEFHTGKYNKEVAKNANQTIDFKTKILIRRDIQNDSYSAINTTLDTKEASWNAAIDFLQNIIIPQYVQNDGNMDVYTTQELKIKSTQI